MNVSSSVKVRSIEPPRRGELTSLEALAEKRFSMSADAARAFFEAEVGRLATACEQMASRFDQGGRLLVFGTGAAATDAQHVAVEFVHPIIAGNQALATIELSGNQIAHQIGVLGRPEDIAMGFAGDADRAPVCEALCRAAKGGMMTLSFSAGANRVGLPADFAFVAPCDNPMIGQEIHETAYHVLWESVHMFLGHRGSRRTATVGVPNPCEQLLYPFLSDQPQNSEMGFLLDDVRRSMLWKCQETVDLRRSMPEHCTAELIKAARAIAGAFATGRRLWTFGNGGSATDAADLAHDFLHPPGGKCSLPAMALTNDVATLTGVANDVGFENVFVRSLIALARQGDVAVGITTSGNSPNIVAGFEAAKRLGLLTVALTGDEGGECVRLAQSGIVDHLFVVPCQHIPRTQEVHATLYHALWELTHLLLEGGHP